MPAPIQITLMRHARSRADDENVHEGRYDSPLTETGRQQVRARAEYFLAQGYKPDAIIASTLIRARESAEIIGQVLGVPIETDPGWMEFNNGPLAGLSFEEADRLYPRPAFRSPFDALHGSGESEIDFHSRVSGALQRVIRRGPGKYLVASHGGALNVALRVAFSIPMPVNNTGIWFSFGDTSFTRLDYYPESHTWLFRELVHTP
jgi:2,3-bisphosphoglycerate-dependent phosphoglycerate mutase